MKVLNKFFISLILLCAIFSTIYIPSLAENSSSPSVKLTSMRMLSSTNLKDSSLDIDVGRWCDVEGFIHTDALKFWVIHASGYNDTESVYYDIHSTNFDTLSGTISAAEQCDEGSVMWVNIYADRTLLYTSDSITPESGNEEFSIDVSNKSEIWVECKTSTPGHGYCIVDANLSAQNCPEKKEYYDNLGKNIVYDISYNEYGQAEELTVYQEQLSSFAIGPMISRYYDALPTGIYTFSYNGFGEMEKVMYQKSASDSAELFAEFRYDVDKQDDITYRYVYRSSPQYSKEWLSVYEIDTFGEPKDFTVDPPQNKGVGMADEYRYTSPYVIINRYGVDLDNSGLMPDSKNTNPDDDGFLLAIAYRNNEYNELTADIINIYDTNLDKKVEIRRGDSISCFFYSVVALAGNPFVTQHYEYFEMDVPSEVSLISSHQYTYQFDADNNCVAIVIKASPSNGLEDTKYEGTSLLIDAIYPHHVCDCSYSETVESSPAEDNSSANSFSKIFGIFQKKSDQSSSTSGSSEQGVPSMSYSEAQEHFPGISSDIIIPADVNDFEDFDISINPHTYKRYSWHIYNDGQSNNYGMTGNKKSSGKCCASYKDTDGSVNYLVLQDGDYFWVRSSLIV